MKYVPSPTIPSIDYYQHGDIYAWLLNTFNEVREMEREFEEMGGSKDFQELCKIETRHMSPVVAALYTKAYVATLYATPLFWDVPPPSNDGTPEQYKKYGDKLFWKKHYLANRGDYIGNILEALDGAFSFWKDVPARRPGVLPLNTTLASVLPNPQLAIKKIRDAISPTGMFWNLAGQLDDNRYIASGLDPIRQALFHKDIVEATESKLPLDKLVEVYLAGTPFLPLFKAPVPLPIKNDDRFNHMHILGGSGAGKTTLIERLVLTDAYNFDVEPSIVLIDPHGDLIKKLSASTTALDHRLILIDPRDTKFPPAVNIFAMNKERMAGYDEATREQVVASVIQTFDYLFSGLIGADLTAKQGVFFRYVARLMLSLPDTMGRNATILDMMHLMADPAPYQKAIASLPDIPRDFFQRDFMSKTFQQTKEQIRYRIQAIIENPTLARLFTSPETKLDLFTELNQGSIILIDTAKDFLKDGSATFGRIFISLVLQAVLERAAIPENKRRDTFLYVDEAASYFDSNIDDLLTEARKYRCGCIFAHQYLDQASSSLRASLAANTSIKFVSGLSAGDARAMSPEMRTTPEFLMSQPKLQFAGYVRNATPHAVSVPVEFTKGLEPRSAEEQAEFIRKNRARVAIMPKVYGPEGPGSFTMDPEPTDLWRQRAESTEDVLEDEDISDEW